ncbi:MAG: hypothetical protein RR743_02260 [Oscillospiraceae bacterium]
MKMNIINSLEVGTLKTIAGNYAQECALNEQCKEASAFELHRFFELNPNLTLRENLMISGNNSGSICHLAQELELSAVLDLYPCQVSVLSREKSALAKAILSGAKLLVCFNTDEEMSADEQRCYHDALEAMSKKYRLKTVLYTTNYIVSLNNGEDCSATETVSDNKMKTQSAFKRKIA